MTLTTEDGLSNNSVSAMTNDVDGRLWIATWDGLNVYDGNSFSIYKHEKGNTQTIPANDIKKVHRDPEDIMWVFTKQYELAMYLGDGKFKTLNFKAPVKRGYFVHDQFPVIQLTSGDYLKVSKNGSETVSENELPKVEPRENYIEILKRTIPDAEISAFLKDSKGNLWFGVRFKGLYFVPNNSGNIRNEQMEHYEHDLYDPYSFSSNEIDDIYEDIFGNIWFAHKDGGLSKLYKGSGEIRGFYPHPKKYPHLPNEAIRAITKDHKSNLWLGYYTHGLYYFDVSEDCFVEFPIHKAKENLNWKRIRSLYTDSQGGVWAGTYAGLIRFVDGKTTYYSAQEYGSLPSDRSYSIAEDSNHKLWIGCWGGLAQFNLEDEHFQFFKGQKTLDAYHIRKILPLNDELIIATEHNGILFFSKAQGQISRQLTEKEGLLGNSCFSLVREPNTGHIWIGSLGGITIYDPNSKSIVKEITEDEGLPSHMVYSLYLDNGKVWAGTTKGVAAIDRQNYEVYAFDLDEGWRNSEFSEGAAFQDDKGILYYGGTNGLDYFSPQSMYFASQLPILKVRVDEKTPASPIEKKYKENNLEVNIHPIAYSSNPNNHIAYQLEGYDDAWIPFSGNPILYKKIPFGDYTLKVKNSLSPIDETFELPIVIHKPYYLSWWFLSATLVSVLLLIMGYVYFRNQKSRRYQEHLEKKIEERTALIKSQKSALESANRELDQKNHHIEEHKEELLKLHNHLKNSDFELEKFKAFVLKRFKAPISKIMELATAVKEKSLAAELKEQSGRLSTLISEWEYLGDAKHLTRIDPVIHKAQNLVRPIIDYLEVYTQKNGVVLQYTTHIPDIWVKTNVLGFRFACKYLLHDVLKYSEKGSELNVDFKKMDENLQLTISSNSRLLLNDFSTVIKFSPYYKAVEVLLSQLGGSCQISCSDQVSIQLKIPVQIIAAEALLTEQVRLEHLDAPSNAYGNNPILVLSEESEKVFVSKLLESDRYGLIFEHGVGSMISALKRLKVGLLVLYNQSVSDDLLHFLKQLKKDKKTYSIPVVFISEQIDYFLQEEMLELGVDDFIQLPIGKELIQKKISKFLELQKKAQQQEKQLQLLEASTYHSADEKLAQKALQLIKEQLTDPAFNVDKMNTMLGISKIKGYRLFKEVFGQSPHTVLQDLRMQKAKYLLHNTNLNISEIGYECGYNQPKYFSKQFKKRYGDNPRTYRIHKDNDQI